MKKKNNIDLSIIVTVYNKEKHLKKCLDSIFKQLENNFEIIIVNDGSTDNSKKIIDNIIKTYNDKNITYFEQNNSGVSVTRNKGIELSNGKYITYIDGDDYAKDGEYKKILNYSIKNNADIVVFDLFDNENDYTHLFTENRKITPEEYLLTTPSPCNKMIKKEILVKNKFKFPIGIIYEDFAMMPVLASYTKEIYYIKTSVICYVKSENSIMRTDVFKTSKLDIFEAINYVYDNLHKNYPDEVEFIFIYHLLVEFSLEFYKFNKYEYIDKISNIMELKFTNWEKNKYLNRLNKKQIFFAKTFYRKKYSRIIFLQKIKNLLKRKK